ncbi:MAG: CHRD domain-containing protein, partial [Gemmatimonadota bacterium]
MRVSRHLPALVLVASGLALNGCSASDATGPLAPGAAAQADVASPMVQTFRAHLSGASEVPSLATNARGEAVFQLSADGTKLTYRLILA